MIVPESSTEGQIKDIMFELAFVISFRSAQREIQSGLLQSLVLRSY